VSDVDKRIWMIGLLMAVAMIAGCSEAPSGTLADKPGMSTMTPVATTSTADASAATGASTTTAPTATTGASAATTSTGTQVAGRPEPLEIVESGYSVTEGVGIDYAFRMRNPNLDFGVQYPAVRLTLRDKAGNVLATGDAKFNRWVMPGETAVLAKTLTYNGRRPARIDFDVVEPGAKWKTASESKSMALPLKTAHLKVKSSGSGIVFTGEAMNPNSAIVDDYAVCIVLRNKSGHIVAGYASYWDEIAPGARQAFIVKSAHAAPAYSTAEAFAQAWSE
jgi:hypothetical protein